jgi:transmembrane sensor
MHDLIGKHLAGVTTDLEARTLERWRAESPDHEEAYRDAEAVWALSAAEALPAREGEATVPEPPALRSIVSEAEARRRRTRVRRERRGVLLSPWLGYGVAAAALLALTLPRLGSRPDDVVAGSLSPIESTASSDDVVTMSLSDGSVVRLAPSTRIEFSPATDRREVVLAGRAFFAVSPGSTPFVVRTAAGDVTVHGTRLEVSTSGDVLRLVLVEGRVSLRGDGGAVEVEAGQIAYLTGRDEPRVIARDDPWSMLDWAGGLLVFQATPLAEVAAELERHFGREVTVEEGLGSRRVTAWFADESLEEVVSAVCVVAGASCGVGAGSITIGR